MSWKSESSQTIPKNRPPWPELWLVQGQDSTGWAWKHKEDRQKQKGSKESCKETNDHHLRRAPAQLRSASSLAWRLLLLPAMELFGVLVLERESLDWQRLGKQRTWWKARGTQGSYLWDWQRDRGQRSWRISQLIWEVERLPQPNRHRVVWDSSWVIFGLTGWNPAVLRSGCFSGLTLFSQSCRIDRPEIAHQNKARQILESKSWWWAKL
jgi:hypothetical protein